MEFAQIVLQEQKTIYKKFFFSVLFLDFLIAVVSRWAFGHDRIKKASIVIVSKWAFLIVVVSKWSFQYWRNTGRVQKRPWGDSQKEADMAKIIGEFYKTFLSGRGTASVAGCPAT